MPTGHIGYYYSPKSTVFSDCLSVYQTSQDLVRGDPALVLSAVTASQTWPASREMGQVFRSCPYSMTGLSVLASDLGSLFWRKTTRYSSLPLLFHCLGEKAAPLQRQAPPPPITASPCPLCLPPFTWDVSTCGCGGFTLSAAPSGASCLCGLVPVITSGSSQRLLRQILLPAHSPVSSRGPGGTLAALLDCPVGDLWVSCPPFSVMSARLSSRTLPSPWRLLLSLSLFLQRLTPSISLGPF